MKKILLILLLIGLTVPVFAVAEWQELQNNGKTFYVDTSSVLQQGTSEYLFWIKQKKSNNVYIKSLMAVNCSNNTGGLEKIITYTNDKVTNISNVGQPLSYIVPDSDSSIAYDYICSMHNAKLRKQEKLKEQQEKNQAAIDMLNTGLGVGLYFLSR